MSFGSKFGRPSREVQPLVRVENREFIKLFSKEGKPVNELTEEQSVSANTEAIIGELVVNEALVDGQEK